ncbi:MAG: tetratricopeptide repeat protein, partial [Calditrichaeota bacterium]|nr:tetratricopeptide repeat protein [Calditrichota bacterium]
AALASFRKQWQTYPESKRSPEALLKAGEILLSRKDYRQAIQTFKKILDNYPQSESVGPATYRIGLTYLQTGDYEQAQSFFNNAIENGKSNRTKDMARLGLARVYLQLHRYPNAIEILEKVLSEADKDISAEAQFLMGEAYSGQKDWQAAVVAYLKTKYLYGNETSWVVRSVFKAGQCNEKLGRLADARRLYQSILKDYAAETEYVKKAQQRLKELVGE